jgi:UPF0716 protein FxsA
MPAAPRVKRRLRLALLAYLLIEGYATLAVAGWLGPGPTLLLLLIGAAAGGAVLRTAQFALLSQLRRGLASGAPVLPALLGGALRVTAGILLIVPGFISDLIAAGLLIPQLRRRLIRRLFAGSDGRTAQVVIEGDYRRVDDAALPASRREPW